MSDDIVIDVTPDEMREWRQQPTTRKFFQVVDQYAEMEFRALSDGSYIYHDSADATVIAVARATGRLSGLNQLCDLVEELQEEEEPDEP